jgi:hypothetical protein
MSAGDDLQKCLKSRFKLGLFVAIRPPGVAVASLYQNAENSLCLANHSAA